MYTVYGDYFNSCTDTHPTRKGTTDRYKKKKKLNRIKSKDYKPVLIQQRTKKKIFNVF